jgi:hypothetical protein
MGKTPDTEFQKYAWARIITGIAVSIAVIVGLAMLINMFSPPVATDTPAATGADMPHIPGHIPDVAATDAPKPLADQPKTEPETHQPVESAENDITEPVYRPEALPGAPAEKNPRGVEFVDALIGPIDHELKRFWGWRPNDIIQFTDNVNEMQLGVLEATRRASVILTDKISRTGSTAALNPHLEQAMNSFMIRADSYWFPAPEHEYREAIKNLQFYRDQLMRGEGAFYTRTDNLIPLLRAFEQLLGSCDDNLVKTHEDSGEPVSTFRADNYFYYAKGVAIAISSILEAVEIDYARVLEVRSAQEVLHHGVEAVHHAAHMKPWLFITEASLNGIFANHRSNMAAHVSHARFYIGLLAETLST